VVEERASGLPGWWRRTPPAFGRMVSNWRAGFSPTERGDATVVAAESTFEPEQRAGARDAPVCWPQASPDTTGHPRGTETLAGDPARRRRSGHTQPVAESTGGPAAETGGSACRSRPTPLSGRGPDGGLEDVHADATGLRERERWQIVGLAPTAQRSVSKRRKRQRSDARSCHAGVTGG
jgi:hypothetical protein